MGRYEKRLWKKNNNNFEVRVLKDEENCKEDEKLLQPISARELYIFKGISICGVTNEIIMIYFLVTILLLKKTKTVLMGKNYVDILIPLKINYV